jgi:hypothetical protein
MSPPCFVWLLYAVLAATGYEVVNLLEEQTERIASDDSIQCIAVA